MSHRKAQGIVNQVEDRLGISLVAYQNNELEWLKEQLLEFLDLEVETDELSDPEDDQFEGGDEEDLGFGLSHDSDDGEDDY